MARKNKVKKISARRKRSKTKGKVNRRYDAPFYKIVPSAIFGLTGLFYLLVPYDLIVTLGLSFDETRTGLLIIGSVFLLIAIVFWIVNRKKSK